MLELGAIKVGANSLTKLNPYLLPELSEMYEVFARKGVIVVKPVSQSCVFCGRIGTIEHMDKYVCNNCKEEMKRLSKRRLKSGSKR